MGEYIIKLDNNIELTDFANALSNRFGIDFNNSGNFIIAQGSDYLLVCNVNINEQELTSFVEEYNASQRS